MPAPTRQQSWFAFRHPAEKILPPPWYEYVDAHGAALKCAWCGRRSGSYRVRHRGELLCSECAGLARAREAAS